MQEMGEIDLSPYAATDPKAEAPDKDPDAGTGIVRDGKLFLCLNQTKSMMELYDCLLYTSKRRPQHYAPATLSLTGGR